MGIGDKLGEKEAEAAVFSFQTLCRGLKDEFLAADKLGAGAPKALEAVQRKVEDALYDALVALKGDRRVMSGYRKEFVHPLSQELGDAAQATIIQIFGDVLERFAGEAGGE